MARSYQSTLGAIKSLKTILLVLAKAPETALAASLISGQLLQLTGRKTYNMLEDVGLSPEVDLRSRVYLDYL